MYILCTSTSIGRSVPILKLHTCYSAYLCVLYPYIKLNTFILNFNKISFAHDCISLHGFSQDFWGKDRFSIFYRKKIVG